MVEAKVAVADLEIRIMDSSSQMTHRIMDNNSHTTQVVEEASLKAGGDKEDVALGTDNNQEQILETVIIVANQAIGLENAGRSKAT